MTKTTIILFQIVTFFCYNLNSQNLISNSGFEYYTSLPTYVPQLGYQAQINKLYNWNNWDANANTFSTFLAHSPDYINTNAWTLGSSLSNDNYGYIGMYNYELIQQQISMLEGKKYALSFYFRLSDSGLGGSGSVDWNNSSLRVLLAKNNITYEGNAANDPTCSNPVAYSDLDNGINQEITEIGRFGYNLTNYPVSSGWHQQTLVFTAPSDNPNIIGYFDWIAFEVVSNNTSACTDGYIFLDDIQLFDFCDTYCASQVPDPPTHLIGPTNDDWPQHMCGNNTNNPYSQYCGAWNIIFDNLNELDFWVYDRWGLKRYEYHSYDVNELVNPPSNGQTWSDFAFTYHGAQTGGGCLEDSEDYIFMVYARNCNNAPIQWADWVTVIEISTQGCYVMPEIQNYDITTCCEYDHYYDNITFPDNFRKDVEHIIYIGENGTASINTGDHAVFNAGTDIETGPYDINVYPGSEVEFNIVPCGQFRIGQGVTHDSSWFNLNTQTPDSILSQMDTTLYFNVDSLLTELFGTEYHFRQNGGSRISQTKKNNAIQTQLVIYFENSVYKIKSPSNHFIREIALLDQQGRLIQNKITGNVSSTELDVSKKSQGIYLIKVTYSDNSFEYKKVVKL